MPAQSNFYGPHTEAKLKAIAAYLNAFLQVVSKQNFETIYVDAFAGSGTMPIEYGGELLEGIEDARTFIEGSALRALKLDRKFSKYIFIEKDARKLAELKELVLSKVGDSHDVEFHCGDANEEIMKICPKLSQSLVRSVVFLDPSGSQVGWSTLKALATTKHTDLWYLFPAGLCVNRQISASGQFTQYQESSLDRQFGPHNWKSRLIKEEVVPDLFGPKVEASKTATIDDITRFKIECMRTIFQGNVLPKWLPLGRDGAHWYSLIFAMANPSKKAKKIGHEVADHIMTNS